MIKNYLWSKSDFLTWTWFKLTNCCLECKKRGFGSINLKHATNVLSTKWILLAFQLGESNLKVLSCHNIFNVQPSKHQRWLPNMQWNLLLKHKQVPRSKLWNEVIKSWKHMLTQLKYLDPTKKKLFSIVIYYGPQHVTPWRLVGQLKEVWISSKFGCEKSRMFGILMQMSLYCGTWLCRYIS